MANFIIQKQQRTTQYYSETLEPDIALDMVLVPGGSFVMGSPSDEVDRQEAESPQHRVVVPTFFMGRYPITQAQWAAAAALPKIEGDLEPNPSQFTGKTHPVENVSWHDAAEFCRRLAQKTNRPYRLPTEAEWEYACRAGTTTPFHFGETISTDLANYDGTKTYGQGSEGEDREETTPVDRFGVANDFGLCDMHGNVWEWCEDHWRNNYKGAPADGSAWLDEGAEEDAAHVRRGGSWGNYPRGCRSASRLDNGAGTRLSLIGFRVVCFAPRTPQPSAL